MKVIRPNCRSQFTPADYAFLVATLNVTDNAAPPLMSGIQILVNDPESMDSLFDNPKLFRAVLEGKNCLTLSLQFYFYVLVRHSLLREEINNREIADYVSEVMAEFALLSRLSNPLLKNHNPLVYLSDMILELDKLEESERFALQSHIGNFALFHSGLFPNRLQNRVERRGAPGFQFYEDLGAGYFRMAGNHVLARRFEMVEIYSTLGEAFHVTRIALNHLSEKLMFLETNRAVNDLFLELDKPC